MSRHTMRSSDAARTPPSRRPEICPGKNVAADDEAAEGFIYQRCPSWISPSQPLVKIQNVLCRTNNCRSSPPCSLQRSLFFLHLLLLSHCLFPFTGQLVSLFKAN